MIDQVPRSSEVALVDVGVSREHVRGVGVAENDRYNVDLEDSPVVETGTRFFTTQNVQMYLLKTIHDYPLHRTHNCSR